MTTMNISLPGPLKEFVDLQVRERGYAGVSDYIRELIRDDQRRAAEAQLRRIIAEGLASGEPIVADDAYFERLRNELVG